MNQFSNMHPADELAWVRAEMKRLSDKERVLKQRLMDDESLRVGVYHYAEVQHGSSFRIDTKRMKDERPDLAEAYGVASPWSKLVIKSHGEDAA